MTIEARRIAALSVVCKWMGTDLIPAQQIDEKADMTFGSILRLVPELNETNCRSLINCRKDLREAGAAHRRSYDVLKKRLQVAGDSILSCNPGMTFVCRLNYSRQLFAFISGFESVTFDYAITRAASAVDANRVAQLISWGVDIEAEARTGTALIIASGTGRVATVKMLLAAKANVNRTARFRAVTALHDAAASIREESGAVIQILLDAKANVNARDGRQSTPLLRAAAERNDRAVRLLIAAKAELDCKNEDGESPLSVATRPSTRQIIQDALAQQKKV